MNQALNEPAQAVATWVKQLRAEIAGVIVGQEQLVDRLLVGLLANGHVLLEGVPGLAKTLSVRTLASAVQASFRRIQFTPDLLPADIVGNLIYSPQDGKYHATKGPVFTNFLLADEINRAPAKVQSALLEVMQEHQVTIAGETYRVDEPFLVMATQNPIETEGTYPLPEAQVDRFMMKVLVGYPREEEEFVIVERVTGAPQSVSPVATTAQLRELQRLSRAGFVDPVLIQYAVKLVSATRDPSRCGLADIARYITFGASPRASINLVEAARALAFLRGRGYVFPQDMIDIAPDVLRHRLVLSYEALSDGVSADELIARILKQVSPPDKPLEAHVRVATNP